MFNTDILSKFREFVNISPNAGSADKISCATWDESLTLITVGGTSQSALCSMPAIFSMSTLERLVTRKMFEMCAMFFF